MYVQTNNDEWIQKLRVFLPNELCTRQARTKVYYNMQKGLLENSVDVLERQVTKTTGKYIL